MQKYTITTCPHCKGEFSEKYYRQPDLVLSRIERDYNKNSDGVYTRRPAYAPHKPKYKKCPMCQEPIDMNIWQKHEIGYEKDPFWQRFSVWQKIKSVFGKKVAAPIQWKKLLNESADNYDLRFIIDMAPDEWKEKALIKLSKNSPSKKDIEYVTTASRNSKEWRRKAKELLRDI